MNIHQDNCFIPWCTCVPVILLCLCLFLEQQKVTVTCIKMPALSVLVSERQSLWAGD